MDRHRTRSPGHWLRSSIAATLVAVALLAVPDGVFACDFAEPPPPEQARDEATAVFSGEVVDVGVLGETQEYAVRFSVERVWKGVSDTEVTVRTHIDEGICGYPFEDGETYLVYAYGEPDELSTALYHRTRHWHAADEDLNALGPGRAIEDVVVEEPAATEEDASLWLYGLALLGVSVLVGLIMYLRRAHAVRSRDSEG
jgi:hypothetical protein